MFEEEVSPHKIFKKTPLSRNTYSNISARSGDSGLVTPKSGDVTDEGEDRYPAVSMPLGMTANVTSSNEHIKNIRNYEVEELVRLEHEEEEEGGEEEEEELHSSSQPLPVYSQPLSSNHENRKNINVSKASRLPHLQSSPEPTVLNVDMKKKSKKLSNKIK